MYSPKIDEELVQKLYHISQAKAKPMTRVVNEIIMEAIREEDFKSRDKIVSVHEIIGNIGFKFLPVKQPTKEAVSSPEMVAKIMKEESRIDRECLWVLHLNSSNRIIEKELASMGIVNAAIIHPREVFKQAIINGATSIITVHNHPANQPNPSPEDQAAWSKLNEAGKIIGIGVIDHIIITPSSGHYSQRENNGV